MPEQLAPPAPPYGRVVRTFTGADGSAASGVVVFTPRAIAMLPGVHVVDASIVAELDETGSIAQDLIASIAGSSYRTYLVSLRGVRYGFDDETMPAFDIDVPVGEVIDLGDLTPVPANWGTQLIVDMTTAERAELAATNAEVDALRAEAAADRAEAAPGGTGGPGVDQEARDAAAAALAVARSAYVIPIGGIPLDVISAAAAEALAGQDGRDGVDGREVALRAADGAVQWRRGDDAWADLLPLSAITGADGTDGTDGVDGSDGHDGVDALQVELRATATALQWHRVGEAWVDLVTLASLRGSDGSDGTDGTDGTNGLSAELRSTATAIQWRVGTAAWTDLVQLSTLKGADGTDGTDGTDGSNGRSVELQKSTTAIQWRRVGDTAWTDLVALTAITGPKGDNGLIGATGPAGPAGNVRVLAPGATSGPSTDTAGTLWIYR